MGGEQKGTEKERKPANQPEAGVHGQKDEGGFGLSGFIQLGKNAVKSKTTFGISVAALDGISFTGILIHLPFDFGICFRGLSATQRGTRQAYTVPGTKEFIAAGLIDPVRQHRAGIETKFTLVILYGSFKVVALIEIAPAGLLQKGITIYHGKVYETVFDVYDGDHPITRGAYQIEWVDDAVIFSVPANSWRKEYGPNQWAPRWWTAKIELGVPGRNAYKYNTYRYADGSLHTENEITYIPPDSGDLSDQTNTNVQETEEELFPGEKIITAGYRALFHELSDSSCEFDIRYGAKESDSTCIVLDNGTYIEYLIYNGRSKNEKCGLYVLYRCEKETDGSYSSENVEIVDMFAVVNDTEKIIRSGKTSWGATGSEEYLLATGE